MSEVPDFGKDLLRPFEKAPSSFVADSLLRLGLSGWTAGIFPFVPTWRFSGRARTVRYGQRTGMIRSRHATVYTFIDECQTHDVLVLAAGGTESWLLGENVIHHCIHQGIRGVVIDGRVRDLAEILTLSMPVFARGAAVRPPHFDLEIVDVDGPVDCGGAQIRSGDLIVGDADGIAVVPQEAAPAIAIEVVDLAQVEKEQEEAIRACVSWPELQKIMQRKTVRKGPPFDPKALISR